MYCLFKVRRKSTGEIVPVYGVTGQKYIEFLIYSGGKWVYVLAHRFEPIEKDGE